MTRFLGPSLLILFSVTASISPAQTQHASVEAKSSISAPRMTCVFSGKFDDGHSSCQKTWTTRDETGVRLGEGSICMQTRGQVTTRFKCYDGYWKRTTGALQRVKRAWFQHYDGCPSGDIYVDAEPARTCAIVNWNPPDGESDTQSGGNPGDCFSEGAHEIKYDYSGLIGWGWGSGDACHFKIHVSVDYCPPLWTVANSQRGCTGERYNVHGSVCTYTCDAGHVLLGRSSTECQHTTWSHGTPTCPESCSWHEHHCWPGDCSHQVAANCVCRHGFKLIRDHNNGRRCDLTKEPDLSTCRVSVSDSRRNVKISTHAGNLTNCDSQQDEWIRTQPTELHFAMKSSFNMDLSNRPQYISDSKVGIVGAKITVLKISAAGTITTLSIQTLDGPPFCHQRVSSTRPLLGQAQHDCEGTIQLPTLNLRDGDSLCADMESFSGGFYNLQDTGRHSKGQETYNRVNKTKRVCFMFDGTKPTHCSEFGSACNSEPLKLSTRVSRDSSIRVHVDGWTDLPPGRLTANDVSDIEKYRLEVHGVLIKGSSLSVRDDHTADWDSSIPGPHDVTMPLPLDTVARLYAIILEVHDHAGNVAYARRLVLFDNTSFVELKETAALTVTSADMRTNLKWQTNIYTALCVDWHDRFYNTDMRNNNFLMPVNPDTAREIHGDYDQQSGILPVTGTDNVDGVVKFELSWRQDQSAMSPLQEVPNLNAQSACIPSLTLVDGQTYHILIRATDIMGNYKDDEVEVSIDHTGPSVSIEGLRGRFGRGGLYVHNTTDLSSMQLLVHAADPHSGIKTLEWSLGTRDLSDDVGTGAVGVNRLDNMTDCSGNEHCYCPSVGLCEMQQYLFTFASLASRGTDVGRQIREYYITITATNHARLHSRQMMDILIDESPPTVGVVLEGLSDDDQAEMDFTSSDVVHVRWHGFLDHESGILLYRVVLADRCLTDQEMDSTQNAIEVEQGNMASLRFPSRGYYFVSIAAYNGAMTPSQVACTDGIVFDPAPENCSAGHYIDVTNGFSCTPCPLNTYTNVTRQYVKCTDCPDGLGTYSIGSARFDDCKSTLSAEKDSSLREDTVPVVGGVVGVVVLFLIITVVTVFMVRRKRKAAPAGNGVPKSLRAHHGGARSHITHPSGIENPSGQAGSSGEENVYEILDHSRPTDDDAVYATPIFRTAASRPNVYESLERSGHNSSIYSKPVFRIKPSDSTNRVYENIEMSIRD